MSGCGEITNQDTERPHHSLKENKTPAGTGENSRLVQLNWKNHLGVILHQQHPKTKTGSSFISFTDSSLNSSQLLPVKESSSQGAALPQSHRADHGMLLPELHLL